MRAVIIGASTIGVMTAKLLLKRNHDVILVDSSKETIQELQEDLDCGFLHGDGSKPAILKETDPNGTDVLFCLTGNDHVNIIAGLVGKSLGFARCVVKIEDPQFDHICLELGLDDTIVPAQTASRYLADMIAGKDLLELSTLIKGNARMFSFVVNRDQEGPVEDLQLPDNTRIICVYRNEDFLLPNAGMALQVDDEVVMITHTNHLEELEKRFRNHSLGK
jgi:trk system potassium uptake protein TrkA